MKWEVKWDWKSYVDNNGNKVSYNMENYMKNSKARVWEDINAPLVEVYHTTTNPWIAFSEFNPVWTSWYRFWKDVVNYYTDSKDMSGSYANQNYKTYEWKAKLYNRADVDNFIKEINNWDYHNYVNKEKLNIEIREVWPAAWIWSDTKYAGYQKWDMNQIKKLEKVVKQLSPEEFELFNNVGKRWSVRDYIESDTDIDYWNNGVMSEKAREMEDMNSRIREKLEELVEKEWISIYDIYDYKKYKKYPDWVYNWMSYKSERELIRNIENDVEYKINWPKKFQYDWYVNLENPYIIDAEWRNWDTVRLENTTLAQETISNWNNLWEKRQAEVKQIIKNAEKEFEEWQEEEWWDWGGYWEYNDEYAQVIAEIFPEKILEEFADTPRWISESAIEWMHNAIKNDMNEADVVAVMNMLDANWADTTNDVVKWILKSNKSWETNYDWIIIKNVIDYWGKSNEKVAPHNLYITFNSNQFKSKYNEFPTEDPDIRYEKAGNIHSKSFKNWFWDWENDPKNASKVVDYKWEPLKVYHWTADKFTIFDHNKDWKNTGNKWLYGNWFYFTDNLQTAREYGKMWVDLPFWDYGNIADWEKARFDKANLMEVYLDMKNPFYFKNIKNANQVRKLKEASGIRWLQWNDYLKEMRTLTDRQSEELARYLQNAWYDGIIYEWDNWTEYAVFNSNQIKSATDNVWTYDKNNPDIRYQKNWVTANGKNDITSK